MAYAIENDLLGQQKIGTVDTVQEFQLGTIVTAVDPVYGGGEFVYLKGVAATAIGSVVSYDQYNGTSTLWAGTANKSYPLAFATAATVANTYGWYQISGAVVAAISGTVAAGDNAFFQAAGVISSTAVAGKQVLGMIAVTANGVPGAGFAVYQATTVRAQGQIT